MLSLDPIWMPDTQQGHFRLLLDAMARPGTCHTLTTVPKEGHSVLAVLTTLLDAEVSLADPHALLRSDDWPMLQTKSATVEQADYVLCDGSRAPNFTPKLGTLPSPEQSATLILVVGELGQGDTHLKLTGPGIANTESLMINGLDTQWLTLREDWVCSFPLGVDLVLVDGGQLAALPRTTKVEVL
jgi:alpha-D-ribose 1-methylphosphonate 5-triphosphate synthase subunit PhnH